MTKRSFIITISFLILSLVAVITCLVLFLLTKPKSKESSVIAIYLCYTLCNVTILGYLIDRISGKEFLGYRIFTVVEGACLMYFLFLLLKNQLAKRLLIISFLVFLVSAVVDFSRSQSDSFDSLPTGIESLIILGFSVFYFFEQLKDVNSLFLYNTSSFWFVVALILFFSGNFFLFIYAQSNSKSPQFKETFTLINTFLSFIENILFLIAFIIAKNQSKTLKPKTIVKS